MKIFCVLVKYFPILYSDSCYKYYIYIRERELSCIYDHLDICYSEDEVSTVVQLVVDVRTLCEDASSFWQSLVNDLM